MSRTADTIASAITDLQMAKANIKNAIIEKGSTVPDEATLDQYPPYILAIPSGGGGLTYVATTSTSLKPD